MQISFFCHSLRSDWNHGNAHFLRGLVTELVALGHDVTAWEPANSWSAENLAANHGEEAVNGYRNIYPNLPVRIYDPKTVDVEAILHGTDLAVVHEWNEPETVAAVGRARRHSGSLRALFHDTHHRSITDPESMSRYDLSNYDGVLAFGESVRTQYLRRGWAEQVWTFHEAADTRVFRLLPRTEMDGDLVWIGNWGDDERTQELREFLIEPVRELHLRALIHGVRYPAHAVRALAIAGILYCDWLPNYRAPEVFARYRFTVHVPRRPYAQALEGVPTIRVFEALACGIPLISAPWSDSEALFPQGCYLTAHDGQEMRKHMSELRQNPELCTELANKGRQAIERRHTCRHRALELVEIYSAIQPALAGAMA